MGLGADPQQNCCARQAHDQGCGRARNSEAAPAAPADGHDAPRQAAVPEGARGGRRARTRNDRGQRGSGDPERVQSTSRQPPVRPDGSRAGPGAGPRRRSARRPDAYPVAELEHARERLVDGLEQLKEGEDPTPQVENFIPALLPVLKVGLRLAGRQRVVDFLAGFLGKLIQKFVGPQYAPPLSKAIVDAGLRLLQLEAATQRESGPAASAVASTIEETVR